MTKAKGKAKTKGGFEGPKKVGRPPFPVTPQSKRVVQLLAGTGVLRSEIATAIGCSLATLERHYKTELASAQTLLTAQAVSTLFRAMRAGGRAAVAAAAFYLKARAGWSERPAEAPGDAGDTAFNVIVPAGIEFPAGHPLQPHVVTIEHRPAQPTTPDEVPS